MSIDVKNMCYRTLHDFFGKYYRVKNLSDYILCAAEWLKRAQDKTNDYGVSVQYSLVHGWDFSYIETTGYILVTFFRLAVFFHKSEYKKRAIHMADFLVKAQMKCGAFPSGTPQTMPKIPRVFNTGEDIRGLIEAYRQTQRKKYLYAACKASDWLITVQEPDGSWIKDEFCGKKHAYHSRTAWALLMVWQETKLNKYKNAAIKNLNWVLKQQQRNGWFRSCDFVHPPNPFTHAIDYTISGLLESGRILHKKTYWNAGKKAADALLEYYKRFAVMPATFNNHWESTDTYACLTGNAQISISWLLLFKETKQKKYFRYSLHLLSDIQKTVDLETKDSSMRGAMAGAYPIYGGYDRFTYPNWATKFFLDACLDVYDIQKNI